MVEPPPSFLSQQFQMAIASCRHGLQVMRHRGRGKVTFWFIALLIGIAAGFAALFFRKGIDALQAFLYQSDDVHHLLSSINDLAWYWIVLIPTAGGLAVGLILHHFTNDARARSV